MRLQAVLVAVMVLRTFGRWDENAGNDSPSGGGNGVGCWKMQLQAALGEVVPLRTFGR